MNETEKQKQEIIDWICESSIDDIAERIHKAEYGLHKAVNELNVNYMRIRNSHALLNTGRAFDEASSLFKDMDKDEEKHSSRLCKVIEFVVIAKDHLEGKHDRK